ncbi:MAG TPA: BatA and WFA domain-containing protein [Terrimicrobiaceae bacterium]|nr:BatA and WFA domain-containing protein [Terrimicrobiaceae bacterium]
MNFLFPAAFFFGALAVAIVALYLRRPRRRSLEVSSLFFWQRVLERQPHRKFLGRLRNPLSLLLQLLIFVLLLLALARPEEASFRGRGSTVMIMDLRARMQAPEVFRAAVSTAQDVVAKLGPNDEMAILAMEGVPRIISSFSNDGKELRERLTALEPSDAGGNLEEALVLGQRLLDAKPGERRLLVIGDRRVPAPEQVEQITVGTVQDNVALLALAQRPLPASPQSAEIFAKLGNFSDDRKNAELELSLDGKPFDLQRFTMRSGEERNFSATIPRELLASGNGLLEARLTAADALAFDNVARAVLPTGEHVRVLLIGEDDPFLEGALKADASIAVEILRPESWRPEMSTGFDVVVFDNWLPPGLTPDSLGPGAFLFFGRTPFSVPGQETATDFLEAAEAGSPLLWNVALGGTRPTKAEKLVVPGDGRWRTSVPIRSAGEPMVLALEGPQPSRVVAVAFGVAESTFPLRVGFPLFVSNVIHWLAGRLSFEDADLKAGKTFLPKEGEEISKEPLRLETGDARPEAASFSQTPLTLRKNGFYQVRKSPETRWLAVNTEDAAESDLRGAQSQGGTSLFGHHWGALPPWRWLALAALILLVVEWLLHHRRVTE